MADFALHALQWEQSAGRFYISILNLVFVSIQLSSGKLSSNGQEGAISSDGILFYTQVYDIIYNDKLTALKLIVYNCQCFD